ncbi:MAG: hypothetical protein AAB472_02860 [Patescibacteria group bacterium]
MGTTTASGIPLSTFSFSALPIGQIIPVFFTLVFVVWTIYTIVAAYHWFRYANNFIVAATAMAMHLFVSSTLALYAVSAMN